MHPLYHSGSVLRSFYKCGPVLRNCVSFVVPHQLSFLSVLFCFYLGNSTVAVSDPLKKTKTEQTEKTTDVAPQKKCSSSELGHSHKNSTVIKTQDPISIG